MELTLHGRIPSKKNSRLTLPSGKTIPSQDYLRWQHEARWQAKMAWGRAPTTKPIRLAIVTSCRNDLDNLEASIMDALEGVVYENDRQVVETHSKRVPKRGEYLTRVRVEEVER